MVVYCRERKIQDISAGQTTWMAPAIEKREK
jgi:hypothetical protein